MKDLKVKQTYVTKNNRLVKIVYKSDIRSTPYLGVLKPKQDGEVTYPDDELWYNPDGTNNVSSDLDIVREVTYYELNKEQIKQYQAEHKDKMGQYRKTYYSKNKEKFRKYARDYYARKHPYKLKEHFCKVCGTKISSRNKFCDTCALDKTKVSRQVISLRRKKLRTEKQNESK